ncbi:LytR/AlgR family response regulator transcription factor [Niallia sp. 03133]|uniref:LytR/AlgR family response regulator transcription factor n=1 Tax=Niallia sp. 03133 TaxID=3458060 RepID=UPI004044B3A5
MIENILHEKPDLVLMDLDILSKDGIGTIKTCKNIQPLLHVIFITSKEHYAVQAFEIGAIDFIVKPFNNSRLYMALGRFLQYSTNNKVRKSKLILKQKNNLIFLPLDEVIFVQKIEKNSYFHTKNKVFESKETLTTINHLLDSRFLLSHRSNIINMDKLLKIEKTSQLYLAHFFNYHKTAKVSKYKLDMIQKYMS